VQKRRSTKRRRLAATQAKQRHAPSVEDGWPRAVVLAPRVSGAPLDAGALMVLERQRDSGRVQRPGRSWTVEQWLTHWVEHIAAPFVSENPCPATASPYASTLSPASARTASTVSSPSIWNGCTSG
jgi:hypothetical protein